MSDMFFSSINFVFANVILFVKSLFDSFKFWIWFFNSKFSSVFDFIITNLLIEGIIYIISKYMNSALAFLNVISFLYVFIYLDMILS